MSKEAFLENIGQWRSICSDRNFNSIRMGTKDTGDDRDLSVRYSVLYNTALFYLAPVLYAAADLHDPKDYTPSLIFDSLPLGIREQKDYQEKVQASLAEGKKQPLFIDLNYFGKNEMPVMGLRLIDATDGEKLLKVINCRDFYIMDTGAYDYGAIGLDDVSGMKLLISRIGDYFLNRKPAPAKIS